MLFCRVEWLQRKAVELTAPLHSERVPACDFLYYPVKGKLRSEQTREEHVFFPVFKSSASDLELFNNKV